MLSRAELKQLLTQAKTDGCTKFPGQKGYKGAGYSVMERLIKFITEEKGIENVNLTKKGLNDLIKALRTDKTFKGLTKFSSEPRKEYVRTPRAAVARKPSLSSLFGFSSENEATQTPGTETGTNETVAEANSWSQPQPTHAEPVTVEEDDPFV